MKNKKNEEQLLKDYIDDGAACCPVCASMDLAGGRTSTDADYHSIEIECCECGSTWEDVYVLKYATNLEIAYNKGD